MQLVNISLLLAGLLAGALATHLLERFFRRRRASASTSAEGAELVGAARASGRESVLEILAHTTDFIITVDPTGASPLLYLNAAALKLVAPQAPPFALEHFFTEASRRRIVEIALRPEALAKLSDEMTMHDASGREFTAHVIAVQHGTSFTLIARDISELKHRHELEQAKAAAELRDRAKSHFLASVSHEIRTPLSAIIGFTELLREGDQGAVEHGRGLEIISRNAKHLGALVDDILDLSKIEAGKMHVERVAFDLDAELGYTFQLLEAQAAAKGLTLTVDKSDESLVTVSTDPTRLRQIVFNLVGNAIKFTQHGGIVVTIDAVPSAARGGTRILQIDVKDSGPGIDPAAREQLFQPFAQGGEATARKFGGTGLGLLLSRCCAEAMGGSLELLETSPKGSTFRLRVDVGLAAVEKPKRRPADPVEMLQDRRVLLVEDWVDTQTVVSALLAGSGASVEIAANGEQGIEAALQQHPDVILMDIQMPVMDGIEATSRLRAKGYDGAIVAMTANVLDAERFPWGKDGFDGVLAKPFDRAALIGTVARHAAAKRTSRPRV
jgi:signal transduction histidine kinase/ActR/RegA family two-component response regulator